MVYLDEETAMDPDSNKRFLKTPSENNSVTHPFGATSTRLLSFEQRRIWLFNIRATDWVVELFSTQCGVYFGNQLSNLIPYEPRWGVQMWHEQWDQWLGYNSTLEVGEKSQWEPEEWQFFPRSVHNGGDASEQEWTLFQQGSGFREMLAQAEMLTQIVHGGWMTSAVRPKGSVVDTSNVPSLLEDYRPPRLNEGFCSDSGEGSGDEDDGEEDAIE